MPVSLLRQLEAFIERRESSGLHGVLSDDAVARVFGKAATMVESGRLAVR